MSFLDWFRRKKSEYEDDFDYENPYEYIDYEQDEDISEFVEHSSFNFIELKDNSSIKGHVISLCEQMIEISREMDDIRREYDQVTNYLNDIQIVEGLEGEQKTQLLEVATNVAKLTTARNDYINAEHKISDEVFNQMSELEEEVPTLIRRLKENEEYLDSVKRDLNRLAGEKIEWSVKRHETKEEQTQLKKYASYFIYVFGTAAVLALVLSIVFEWSMLPLLLVAFVATLAGAYIVLRLQDCTKEIQKCNVNQNYIITLENRIKIKYVNAKNAVDYSCQRFHVMNSRELSYNYEQYIEICKEREKFKQANEDLEYYNGRLVRIMNGLNLYDAKIWLNYANAILNPKEMVEVKHDLFIRRQNVRTRIENNLNALTDMRREVEKYINKMGDKTSQVRAILEKVDELNKGIL